MGAVWKNWAGNQRCRPALQASPSSEDQISELVDLANARELTLRVVGAGHSFTGAVPTDGMLLSLDRFGGVVDVDHDNLVVTVQAGIRLAKLNEQLAQLGMALPNLGDINYQSVAGALATSTHGTGLTRPNLSAAATAMRVIGADARPIDSNAELNADLLRALRVSVGALGIVTRVSLQCVPAFSLHAVESRMDIDETLDDLDHLIATNDHFEFFWVPGTRAAMTKANNVTDQPIGGRTRWERFRQEELEENAAFGAFQLAASKRPTLIPRLAKALPDARRVEYIDRSDRVFTTPRRVRFCEMEYAVPLEHLRAAFQRVRELVPTVSTPVTFPVEVRASAGDDAMLSTAHGRPTGYIAVHLYKDLDHSEYFRATEGIMDDFDGRPHWGKVHYQTAETLAPRYPEWETFQAFRDLLDPNRRFTNPYIEKVLG